MLVFNTPGSTAVYHAEYPSITIILRQAEQLPTLGDRLVLFAIGIVLFGIPLQVSFAIIGFIQRRLCRIARRRAAKAA